MFTRFMMLALVSTAAIGLAATGCSGPADQAETGHDHADHDHDGHDHADHKHDHTSSGHDHSQWWCAEHGVPEEECGQCSPKVAAELKKKGDWCNEHDRPDSQCFVCHPEYEAKFAARYEAKYGKAPPKMN